MSSEQPGLGDFTSPRSSKKVIPIITLAHEETFVTFPCQHPNPSGQAGKKHRLACSQRPSRWSRDGNCHSSFTKRKGVNYSPGINKDLISLNIPSTAFPSASNTLLSHVLPPTSCTAFQPSPSQSWHSLSFLHQRAQSKNMGTHISTCFPSFQPGVSNSSNKRSKCYFT